MPPMPDGDRREKDTCQSLSLEAPVIIDAGSSSEDDDTPANNGYELLPSEPPTDGTDYLES